MLQVHGNEPSTDRACICRTKIICTNCSTLRHNFAACPSPRICPTCQMKLHGSLCPVEYAQKHPTCSTTSSTTSNSSNTVTASSGNAPLQTNVLSDVSVKAAPLTARKHVRLGVLAVEICNPTTGVKKSIYAFNYTSSQMTLSASLPRKTLA